MSDTGNDFKRSSGMPQLGSFEELVVEILARLPAKDAAACKSVSKHWLRLISEPNFPALNLNRAKKELKYIIYPYPVQFEIFIHMSLMEENGHISREIPIYGYEYVFAPQMNCFTNGLICTAHTDPDERDDNTKDVIVRIFNPMTKNSLYLPKGSPSLVFPAVGVAFDPKTNDFKAFRFFSDLQDCVKYKCEVYEKCTASWRRISDEVEYPRPYPSNEHLPYSSNEHLPCYVSVAGTMYWFLWPKEKSQIPVGILSVDMNENFKEIALPRVLSKWSFLIELEGRLGLVLVERPIRSSERKNENLKLQLEVYKLQNHQWCLRIRSAMEHMDIRRFNSIAARDNEIFFIINLVGEYVYSFSYLIFDMVGKTWTTLNLRSEFNGFSPIAYPFAESLLKCGEDAVVYRSSSDDDEDDDDDDDEEDDDDGEVCDSNSDVDGDGGYYDDDDNDDDDDDNNDGDD